MAYPVLAAQNTWWKPNVSSVTHASITEIEIMDSYTPDSSVTVVDSWDASAAKNGSITCYVIGTKLIIAGNGSGKIAANADSSYCFGINNLDFSFITMTKLTSANLLDVSDVVNMCYMFMNCRELSNIDVTNWDVSNVVNMYAAFSNCRALTNIDLSSWNVSNATDMTYMFLNNYELSTVGDLSNWDVSNVTTFEGTFRNCYALSSLNLSNWNVSKVVKLTGMFIRCGKLSSICLSNWNVSNVTDMYGMFGSCTALTSVGDLSTWDVSNVTNMQQMFVACASLTTIGNISNWNTSNVTSMAYMFESCSKLTGIGDLANWNPSSCTDMSFMFWGASSIGEIDVSKWDTAKLTNLDHFAAHAGLRRIGMEKWNTSSLVNANAAFHNCAEEELDLSGWDVSKVQIFSQMFENSPNLKRIKGLENWNTSAGLDFSGMFERCYVLEELDLSSFNTSKAKNGVTNSGNGGVSATLNNMFLSCNNLKKVTVGANWSVNGDGTNTTAANKAILPTPSAEYIEGADGYWYTFNGDQYAPNAMQNKTAATYYASRIEVYDADVIVKNSSLIDTAKAIREKNGATTQYTPSEFGAAIRAL